MTLISDTQSPEVLQPSEKPLDFPAALIPPQLSVILSFWLRAVAAMWRNHLNAVLFQKIIIELVAVICFIANEFFRFFSNEKALFPQASLHESKHLQGRRRQEDRQRP